LPEPFRDPRLLKDVAFERRCDRAAVMLAQIVYGLPPYHPLMRDADSRITELKRVFDSFPNGYHLVTPLEAEFLEVPAYELLFLPDLPPLGRPATEDDVKAGRAVFQLKGKGRLARLQLPAVALLKRREKSPPAGRTDRRLLIIQAEVNADGKTMYGVIGDGAAHTARAEELTDIKPIKKSFFDFLR
jgi:hypothetical protein